MDALASFHPAVRTWFERRFEAGPTEPQASGWPAIAVRGEHTLIAAPTGSGKTLAAFLVCIDRLIRQAAGPAFNLEDETQVVLYVSPLKALASDIHCNLEEPLAQIRRGGRGAGHPGARDPRPSAHRRHSQPRSAPRCCGAHPTC